MYTRPTRHVCPNPGTIVHCDDPAHTKGSRSNRDGEKMTLGILQAIFYDNSPHEVLEIYDACRRIRYLILVSTRTTVQNDTRIVNLKDYWMSSSKQPTKTSESINNSSPGAWCDA